MRCHLEKKSFFFFTKLFRWSLRSWVSCGRKRRTGWKVFFLSSPVTTLLQVELGVAWRVPREGDVADPAGQDPRREHEVRQPEDVGSLHPQRHRLRQEAGDTTEERQPDHDGRAGSVGRVVNVLHRAQSGHEIRDQNHHWLLSDSRIKVWILGPDCCVLQGENCFTLHTLVQWKTKTISLVWLFFLRCAWRSLTLTSEASSGTWQQWWWCTGWWWRPPFSTTTSTLTASSSGTPPSTSSSYWSSWRTKLVWKEEEQGHAQCKKKGGNVNY